MFEWNASLSEVQEPAQIKVHLSAELQSASAVLPTTPLFSCPLYLPKVSSLKRSTSPTEVQHGITSKVQKLFPSQHLQEVLIRGVIVLTYKIATFVAG